jgi:hypothetical protein
MKMAGSRTITTPNTAMIIVSVFLFELRFTVPINPCQQKDYVGDQFDHEKHSLKTSWMPTNKKLCKWTEARL